LEDQGEEKEETEEEEEEALTLIIESAQRIGSSSSCCRSRKNMWVVELKLVKERALVEVQGRGRRQETISVIVVVVACSRHHCSRPASTRNPSQNTLQN
jgi:hypothetical protein